LLFHQSVKKTDQPIIFLLLLHARAAAVKNKIIKNKKLVALMGGLLY